MRVAFGISCCERMFGNYVECKRRIKWGDERPLRQALDALWNHIECQKIDKQSAERFTSSCETVAPNSDDFSELLTTPAQDTCFAICAMFDYVLTGELKRIAQVSSFGVDTVDLYVQELIDGFRSEPRIVPNNPNRERQIRLHPLMQRELARQNADLELLATHPNVSILKSKWRAPEKSSLDFGGH